MLSWLLLVGYSYPAAKGFTRGTECNITFLEELTTQWEIQGSCKICPASVALAQQGGLAELVLRFVRKYPIDEHCTWGVTVNPFEVSRGTAFHVRLPTGLHVIHVDRWPPFALLESIDSVGERGLRAVKGWVLGDNITAELHGPYGLVDAKALQAIRTDVDDRLPSWRPAFSYSLLFHEAELPAGHTTLRVVFQSLSGRTSLPIPFSSRILLGTSLVNQSTGYFADPDAIDVRVWVTGEDGHVDVSARADPGEVPLAPLPCLIAHSVLSQVTLTDPQLAFRVGSVYGNTVDVTNLLQGVYRIVLCAVSAKNRTNCWPGPIVQRSAKRQRFCAFQPVTLFLPGDATVARSHFPLLRGLRPLFDSQCTRIGVRMRLEYLRSTHGVSHNFTFDAEFRAAVNDSVRLRLTGVALMEVARILQTLGGKVPVLWTLDGGVWADSSFSWPEYDAVDFLEQDPRRCQWNQFNSVAADDALRDLSGSISAPQLARMMSLNRYNSDYRAIKERNLKDAVRSLLSIGELDTYISLDPDNYINPWFAFQQWYDYNPLTIRQFREWLFHLGPYNSSGVLARDAFKKEINLQALHELGAPLWKSIQEIDPPRGRPDYHSPWHLVWTRFKRHLVKQHYEDLVAWASAAGMPSSRIWTSQGVEGAISIDEEDPAHDWADVAGVYLGAGKPSTGHLGVLFYGPTSRNSLTLATTKHTSLFEAIWSLDRKWAVIEMNPSSLHSPYAYATHHESYETMFFILNFGAEFFSPMVGGNYQDVSWRQTRAYDTFLGTPFEYQMLWWLQEWRHLGKGCHYFPFGNAFVNSFDGWTATENSTIQGLNGKLLLAPVAGQNNVELYPPLWLQSISEGLYCVLVQGRNIEAFEMTPQRMSIKVSSLLPADLDFIAFLPSACSTELSTLFDGTKPLSLTFTFPTRTQ